MGVMAKCLVSFVAMPLLSAPVFARSLPATKAAEPPRQTMDTVLVTPRGRTHVVRAGGDVQAALNAAAPGDVITLEAGATFTGPFTLPAKPGSDWIIIRSSVTDGSEGAPAARKTLPPPGRRIDPVDAPLMPKLVASFAPAIVAAPGAHHYRFIGIEIHPGGAGKRVSTHMVQPLLRATWRAIKGTHAASLGFTEQTLVSLGVNETLSGALPHHIIFDRCYLHGDPKGGARRGIALNSRYTAVIDSYLSDFKAVGVDSQALAGWNGPGPFKIVNNYLEGAGENVMFGGGAPSIAGLVPSDIEIRGNHFAKPLAWKIDDPSYEGTPWTVKNLFELKNARRVWIEGNLFERSWEHAQDGYAFLFTVRTEMDKTPWAVVEDVTVTNNVIRHSAGGINIMGIDDSSPSGSGRARRIDIKNNLFEEIGSAHAGGRLFQLLDGTPHVVIEHNTAFPAYSIVVGERSAHSGFVFANNIVLHGAYGIIGTGTGVGRPTLERYFPGATIRRNVVIGGSAHLYPRDNFFPESLDAVGFVNRARGDYRLRSSSRYTRAATDGADVGVDFGALCAALLTARPAGSFPFCT